MDLDNINDIEVLRNAAKQGRVQIKKDINADIGNYTFKKGYWYLVNQDEYDVSIYSEDYNYVKTFTYREASRYLNEC